MGYTHLELTVISAKGLKDIGKFSNMDVYVAVTINGDPRTEQTTPVDQDGGSSPKWSHPMKFPLHDYYTPSSYGNHLNLSFRLRHERVLLGDKDVGEVHVPVQELLDKVSPDNNATAILAEFPVRSASGKKKGKLKFSYKFGSAHGSHCPDQAAPSFASPYKPPISLTKPYPPPGPTMPPAMEYPPSGPFLPPPTGYPSSTAPLGYYPGAAPPAGYSSAAPTAGYPGSIPLGYPSSTPVGYPGSAFPGYHSTAPAGYYPGDAPPAGYPSAAPTAGYPGTVPLGYPSSATAGYHSTAPAGYPVPAPPVGYPGAAPPAGHPGSVPLGYPSGAPADYTGNAPGYHSAAPAGYPVAGPGPGYPPPESYAAGSSSYAYSYGGYPSGPLAEKNKSGKGAALGLGILGGLVGGTVLGGLASD